MPPASHPRRERRGRLPAELTPFVGRRREVAEVRRVLSTARLLTLTGVGGVGKTRLAIRVALETGRAFRDGVWLVDLASVADASELELSVAATLGVFDRTGRRMADVLPEYLAGRELLLVLDNCEHLVDACAQFVGRLLPQVAGLRVLCTSRQALGMIGEHVLPVPPLAVPDPVAPAPVNGEYTAVALFADRAAAVVAGFSVSSDNHRAVVDVCRRLDGLPLAIELAAAQLRSRSIHQLSTALGDSFQVLRARHAMPIHHRTLWATFDWSFDLCTPQEQAMWARLAVFHDSFAVEAAQEVCADAQVPAERVPELLSGLVDKSVVFRESGTGSTRYRLLETVRQYGWRHLPADGEVGQSGLRHRHLDWYLRLARRFDADWFGPRQLDWLARLRRERANLYAALGFGLNPPADATAGVELATRLVHYWDAAGLLHEARYWLEHALAADPEPSAARAVALAASAYVTLPQGEYPASTPAIAELREIAQRLGDAQSLALAHRAVGMNAMMAGDLPTAAAELSRALERYAQIGEAGIAAAMTRLPLALTVLFLGDLDRAAALADENRAVCQAHGDRWYLSHTISAASHIALRAGDTVRAKEHARASLELAGAMGNVVIAAVGVERLAWFAGADGQHERAARLLGAADQMWRTLGQVMFGADQWRGGHDACVAGARAALGESAYLRAWTRPWPPHSTSEPYRRDARPPRRPRRSPRANVKWPPWSRRGCQTSRSPTGCTPHGAPRKATSATSCASWASRPVPRSRPG
jgi:predicted ATPase